MSVADIIKEQDDLKAHCWDIVLWPKKWQDYSCSQTSSWETYRLGNVDRENIPDQPGIYTLLIQPGIAKHPACSYLMYVGKATSLRNRFRNYLVWERRESGRPKIVRLLNKYSDHLWFCFCRIPQECLTEVEDALITAHLPPCNDQLPAEIRAVRGAFP